ncbi:MAG: DUF1587 domain-containing protein, partial [Pseudomonadales bacterium]
MAGCAMLCVGTVGAAPPLPSGADVDAPPLITMLEQYCMDCHTGDDASGDIDFDGLKFDDPVRDSEAWEKVILKLRHRQMPPQDEIRPDESTYEALAAHLETTIDRAAALSPRPGRTDTFRRLTRMEYRNAIRDLLRVEVDAASLLPKDEESHGFDNVTVGTLSPTLIDRYISAARKISRLAVGRPSNSPGGDTFRIPPDHTQEKHVDGLPLGTRGGTLLSYTFPRDGEYEFEVLLTRDRNEHVEGLNGSHEMEILIDRAMIKRFTVERGRKSHSELDKHLKTRTFVQAGPRKVGVTFLKKSFSLSENKRQPFAAHFNMHRHPRLSPAVYQISITGPFESKGAGKTPSREKIFIRQPNEASEE